MIMDRFESTYDKILEQFFTMANPIKKSIIKTKCLVHKSINQDSIIILKNDLYWKEFYFFSQYIDDINEGAVWADQDFKSSNHFYNPFTKKGLFGRSSAMDLGMAYYHQALESWKIGGYNEAMFYFGAYLHIVQDMTIPQHVNIRLLDNHRQYETYIKKSYEYVDEFKVENGAHLLNKAEDYIRFNTRVILRAYNKFKAIKSEKERFYRIALCGLPLAKRTTAGAMVLFYRDLFLKGE